MMDKEIQQALDEMDQERKARDAVDDDMGPWIAGYWSPEKGSDQPRVMISSEDFNYDVALTVTGDFASLQQKFNYAERLAERMNKMDGTRQRNWWRKKDE